MCGCPIEQGSGSQCTRIYPACEGSGSESCTARGSHPGGHIPALNGMIDSLDSCVAWFAAGGFTMRNDTALGGGDSGGASCNCRVCLGTSVQRLLSGGA